MPMEIFELWNCLWNWC